MNKFRVAVAALSVSGLMSAPAAAEWWEARTEHFIVYSEGAKSDAEELARSLERFDMAMRSVQNIPADNITSDAQRPTVFRTGKQPDIARLAGSSDSGIAGFYIPRAGGSVAFVPAKKEIRTRLSGNSDRALDPQTVLFHEYAHYFMLNHFPATYPSWYVEGFAEFYGNIDLREAGSFHLGNPPQYRGYDLFASTPYSVKKLFEDQREQDERDYYARYSMGWLLTHYLTFTPERSGQLKKYLTLINSGKSSGSAAVEAFGDLGKLDSDTSKYLRKDLPGFMVKPAAYVPPATKVRALTAAEEKIIKLRMLSKRGVDKKEAASIVADARRLADLSSNSTLVALTLAEAEYDTKNWDQAAAAARRALALDPKSSEAMLFLGQIEAGKAKLKQGSFDAARRHYAAARIADPDNPLPYFMTYMTYVDEGKGLPATARNLVEAAYDRAPYDSTIRLRLVQHLLIDKEGKLAGQILNPIAFASHGKDKKMREVATLIAAGKLDEARGKIAEVYAKQEADSKKE